MLDLSQMFDAKQSNCQIVDNLSNVDRSSGIDNIAQYPDLVKSLIEHGNNVKKKKKKRKLLNHVLNILKMK